METDWSLYTEREEKGEEWVEERNVGVYTCLSWK